MKRLEDMTLGHRIMLTVVIIVAALLVLAIIGWWIGGWDKAEAQQRPSTEPDIYAGIPLDASLLRLDKQALDDAYHDQVVKLFMIWLSEQAGDPTRISTGLKNARRAYNLAASRIARREQELLLRDLQEQQERRQ